MDDPNEADDIDKNDVGFVVLNVVRFGYRRRFSPCDAISKLRFDKISFRDPLAAIIARFHLFIHLVPKSKLRFFRQATRPRTSAVSSFR